jgi:6-phosphogluconolactonase
MSESVKFSVVEDVPEAFAHVVRNAFVGRTGERFSLVLSGGPTARACYERLAGESAPIDWTLVDIFMGDERIVPAEDPDANQRLVHEALLDQVGPVGSFSPMPTDGEPGDCAARYQVVIASLLASAGIDLIHLGLGPDGHTASLFPHAADLEVADSVLVSATVDPNGVNPHPRLTLTLPAINRARQAVFTVTGAAKHEAFAGVQAGADLPGARVHAQRVLWLVDQDTAGPGQPAPTTLARP